MTFDISGDMIFYMQLAKHRRIIIMRKIKKIISGITALAMACGLSVTASAELKKGDSKAYRGTGYLAKYEVVSVKEGKTTVKFTLKNTSKKKINNWAVRFINYANIESVKYGRLLTPDWWLFRIIKDNGTNGSVAPNECVSFSFTMSDPDNSSDISDIPDSIKVYSDLDKSNTVDSLNQAAKVCYHTAVAGVLEDYETKGISIEECFGNGVFEKSNSEDGMKTGFNYKYKAYGDWNVNITASQYARGNISVYVGRMENNSDSVFVQVKDNKTGKVGQFPHPTDGTAEWGTFDLSSPIYTNYSTESVNNAAEKAYNAVAVYQADMEAQGLDFWGSFENGGFRQAHSDEGLKIDFAASLSECDERINDDLKLYYDGMIIYVGKTMSDGEQIFFVQAKDPRTGKIGQYRSVSEIR